MENRLDEERVNEGCVSVVAGGNTSCSEALTGEISLHKLRHREPVVGGCQERRH